MESDDTPGPGHVIDDPRTGGEATQFASHRITISCKQARRLLAPGPQCPHTAPVLAQLDSGVKALMRGTVNARRNGTTSDLNGEVT